MSDAERTMQVGHHEIASLKQDMTDMKTLMSRMVEAMGRITIIEERQSDTAQAVTRVVERMETLSERQHTFELAHAASGSVVSRLGTLETSFRDLFVEGERNKARFQTVVWTMRGLWAVIGVAAFVIFQLMPSFGLV